MTQDGSRSLPQAQMAGPKPQSRLLASSLAVEEQRAMVRHRLEMTARLRQARPAGDVT